MKTGRITDAAAGARAVATGLLGGITLHLTACYPGSDAQYATRQSEERQAESTRALRAATAQAAPGSPLTGAALRDQVLERTWSSEFARFPNGDAGPYRTYDYFRRDGQFIWAHNWIYGEDKAVPGDRWRVDGARLCIVHQHFSHQEKCYTAALDAHGALQLYIDAPGTPNHGLLTRVIRHRLAGPPPPMEHRGK